MTADPASMLGLESRPSDSPYVERVWRSAARGGVMTSVAASHREIVFWWEDGSLRAAVGRRVTARGIVMAGEEVPVPDVDSAEGFVERLVRTGLLRRDALVDGVLAGGTTRLGRRSVERRVLAATGLSRGEVGRIRRARQAAVLLGEGAAPLDVVGRLGYHDHPHLARSVRRYLGYSPSALRAPDTALSLLYRVDDLPVP